jgi:Xaa-Pro aminopeptidase
MSAVFLRSIREKFIESGVDAFIVGSEDAHQSEYVHESDMRRAYVTKFTGSAGTALITKKEALLWTDGRYFLQASKQLSGYWTLMKTGQPNVPDMKEWILNNVATGCVVGVDPLLISASQAKQLTKYLEPKNIFLNAVGSNPVDCIWTEDKPTRPKNKIAIHDVGLAGVSHSDKIRTLQKILEEKNASAFVVSMLDEV